MFSLDDLRTLHAASYMVIPFWKKHIYVIMIGFHFFFHCLLVFIIYSLYMKVRIQKMIDKSIRMEYFKIG